MSLCDDKKTAPMRAMALNAWDIICASSSVARALNALRRWLNSTQWARLDEGTIGNMRVVSVSVFAAIFAALVSLPVFAGGEQTTKIRELIALHDLDTSVSVGNYYLKQESLASIRSFLARLGREENLGDGWNDTNPWWRQAEESLLEQMMQTVDRDFSSLEWLQPQWIDLFAGIFSEEEIEALVAHFQTNVGGKQLQIIDHTVSTHVMMTLSFSGKFRTLPGIEDERARMQDLWNDEDERMRFSIQGAANADGQAFALSPLGKKYFTTVILNLTGIVNRRIEQVATQGPAAVERLGGRAQTFVDGFKREPV